MEHLRERIKAAFPLGPIPQSPIISTYDDEDIIPTFLGRPWNNFTTRELREHCAAITFLTEDAFLYYLPAFLMATVQDQATADIIPDNLLTKFARAESASIVDRLTSEQRVVVLEFLSACFGDDPCYLRDLSNAMDKLQPGWNGV